MARSTAARNAEDSDGASAAIAAQQRIFQLKKERDEKIKDVVSKSLADLDAIKNQVSQEREERERQRKQKKAKILSSIAKSMQKRNAIEESMMAVVTDMDEAMAQLEDSMTKIYDAKKQEVQKLLQNEQNVNGWYISSQKRGEESFVG